MSAINQALRFFGALNKYEITAKLNMREAEHGQKLTTREEVEKELKRLVSSKEIGLSMKTLDEVQYYVSKGNK